MFGLEPVKELDSTIRVAYNTVQFSQLAIHRVVIMSWLFCTKFSMLLQNAILTLRAHQFPICGTTKPS